MNDRRWLPPLLALLISSCAYAAELILKISKWQMTLKLKGRCNLSFG